MRFDPVPVLTLFRAGPGPAQGPDRTSCACTGSWDLAGPGEDQDWEGLRSGPVLGPVWAATQSWRVQTGQDQDTILVLYPSIFRPVHPGHSTPLVLPTEYESATLGTRPRPSTLSGPGPRQ